MELGGWGFLSFELGGGPGGEQKTYRAMRSAVGLGGSAKSPDTVEDLWRRAKAAGVACGHAAVDRAIWQAWPSTATDRIASWEELLGTVPPVGAYDEDRREIMLERFARRLRATGPGLLEHLEQIDDQLSTVEQSHASSTTTFHGRAFEDHAATEPFGGGRKSTAFPNYSDGFVETVLFDIAGAPDPSEQRVVELVRDLLNEVQPAWCAFRVVTDFGILLDTSPLDVTGFDQ